ncbi:MAG TPA: hypothetical protein VGJ37_16330 [Pyrinomonadaceae bacterium]|jgi:hypothetical protein
MRILFTLLLLGALYTGAFAQRPRTMDPEPAKTPAPAAAAPASVKAKYEGGYFGYNKTMEGTLTFDDANERLVFKDKKTPKEISMPYESLTSAYADTKKVQPAAATVASNVPTIYSLPARFIKTKVRYLTLQYSDPDSHVSGIMSYKIENKELLESVLVSLAQKAGMTQRGDIYVKKRDDSSKLNP